MSFTVYVVYTLEYSCFGLCSLEIGLWSPKSHVHCVGAPLDWSLNWTLKPFVEKVNLAFMGAGVAIGVGVGGPFVGGRVGKPDVSVGSGVNVGESDGKRMNVGDGLGLGVAVACTKGGSVGEPEAKATSVGSAVAGGLDR